MKKFLLPEHGNFYKANLHAHTNMSDGSNTPEEVREIFKAMGYSIVAYTDHDVLVDRSHLCQEDFLALNGLELEINGRSFGKGWLNMETTHLNMIALEPDNLIFPCYHRTRYLYANAPKYRDLLQFDESLPDYVRSYTPACINEMLQEGRSKGFYTVYNHPTGSLETYPIYSQYENMHAVEVFNGDWENSSHVYNDLLTQGKMIHCVAGDDSHSKAGSGHAWTVIKADKLEYRAVTDALLKGNFYCSRGPEIKELYVEDGVMHVKTSDAQAIMFTTMTRNPGRAYIRSDDGSFINEASFKVLPECIWVRITVFGHDGRMAVTNAYPVEDLLED